MLALFGVISGLLALFGELPYIRDILKHKTKPHRVTWFTFVLLSSIAFFSQLAKGATNSLWFPLGLMIIVLVVFLLSLKYGIGGVTKRDFFILFVIGLGLLGWYLSKEAAVALYIVILIDAVGVYPTIEKAYKDPNSETFISWFTSAVAGFFSALAVGSFNIVLLSYPVALFLIDITVVTAILLGRAKKIT